MKRSSLLIAVAVLVLVAVGGLFGVRIVAYQSKAAEPRKTEAQPPVVAVLHPTRVTLTDAVHFAGVVRPRNELDVSAKVGGRIQELRVDVGQSVKAGQLLAVVEHTELGFQSEQARAQVEATEAQVLQAQIQLAAAQTQHARALQLQAGGAVSQTERERTELGLRGAEAGVRAAQAQLRLAQASAGLAGRAVQNSYVTAPIAGTVVKRMISLGTQIAPGQALFQIQDVAELKLAGAVTASDFAQLKLGQEVEIRIEELPGAAIRGRLATLSPSLDPMTRRASVEIAIDNSEGRLLSNMFARAEVAVGARHEVLTVPLATVVSLPTGKVVYVVREGRARTVSLPAVEADHETMSVEGLLVESDSVIARGQSSVSDGQLVRVEQPGKAP